jgi:asparagine synthetase B (glutamine-hydrolysing)
LDYRVVEAALNLPDKYKINHRRNKEVLRSLIERLYPPSHREKGKQAFYMPLLSQYREKYDRWASSLLTPQAVARRGLFQWPYIQNLFELSAGGSMLASRQLTVLAMLELWFKVFLER